MSTFKRTLLCEQREGDNSVATSIRGFSAFDAQASVGRLHPRVQGSLQYCHPASPVAAMCVCLQQTFFQSFMVFTAASVHSEGKILHPGVKFGGQAGSVHFLKTLPSFQKGACSILELLLLMQYGDITISTVGFCLLGYNAFQPVGSQPTFRRNLLLPSSGSTKTSSKTPNLLPTSRYFLA